MPLVRNRIDAALDTLRHERIEGVLVDGPNTDVDVLEFVLNIRDVDGHVPILVTESRETLENLRPALQAFPRVRVAVANGEPEQAVSEFEGIVRESKAYS